MKKQRKGKMIFHKKILGNNSEKFPMKHILLFSACHDIYNNTIFKTYSEILSMSPNPTLQTYKIRIVAMSVEYLHYANLF